MSQTQMFYKTYTDSGHQVDVVQQNHVLWQELLIYVTELNFWTSDLLMSLSPEPFSQTK